MIAGLDPQHTLPLDWAVALHAADNSAFSGDQYLVYGFDSGVLIAVVDGLGHGEKAEDVARTAIRVLQEHAHEPLDSLFRRCHHKLIGTRGVVISLASLDIPGQTLAWLGVGNVEGVLLRSDALAEPRRESLLLRGGIVGYRLPNLRLVVRPLAPGDLLILATDGLRSAFAQDPGLRAPSGDSLSGGLQEMADHLLARYLRGSDDALILLARYLGPPASQAPGAGSL